MEFKDTIKALRIKNGLDRKAAADKLGIAYQTLGHYESGRSEAPYSVLKDMANLYGVTIGELFGETIPRPVTQEEKKDLLIDIVKTLHNNGMLKETDKFDDLDLTTQEIIKSVLNKMIESINK